MYITVNRKTIWVDEERPVEERKRIARIIQRQDKKLREIDAEKKRRGYCLTCHILLTQYGKCSKCGAIWKFHQTQH